jgi:hypothetical protein
LFWKPAPKGKSRHDGAPGEEERRVQDRHREAQEQTLLAVVAALYSKRVVTASVSGLSAVPFGACAAAGIFAWDAVLVWTMRRLGHAFPRGLLQWIVRGMGLFLIGLGVWSGVDFVRYFARHGS